MKKNKNFIFLIALIICSVLQARVVPQGESLWSMTRLVTQASCDVTIRQSDFSGGSYIISQSGVYCLAENITGMIIISNMSGVVLDLNGKTVSNSGGPCIAHDVASRVIIKNGSLVATNNSGIEIADRGSGTSERIYIENVTCYGCAAGIKAISSNDIIINSCDFISSDTGCYFNSVSRLTISDTKSLNSVYLGFSLNGVSKSLFSNCLAINTGSGLADQTTDIYSFYSLNGSNNIFRSCTAQNTLALTVTGSPNKAAGFALSGTESNSQITNCTSDVAQTSASGFATPYGILLDYSFDALTTVTGGNQGIACYALSWSPDGVYLATSGRTEGVNDEIQIFSFDRAVGFLTTLTGASQGSVLCYAVAWSPDGSYLATGGQTEGVNDDIQIFSFDPVSGLLTKITGVGQGSLGRSVSWSPDGTYLATGGSTEGSDDIQLFYFDPSAGTLNKLTGASQGGLCYAVAWSPDGAYLATGGQPEGADEIQLFSFNRSTGTLTKTDGQNQGTFARSISWSSDGAYVATGGNPESGDEIQVFSFDSSTGTLTRTDNKSQGTGPCNGVAWSPDGAYLATGGFPEGEDEIQVFSFDRVTGLLTKLFAANQGSNANAVAWSPDGVYLATGGDTQDLNEFQIFKTLVFPSNNMILDNVVQSSSRSSSIAGGIGISGSSIENMMVGNRSYNNATFNYQFVTNVFDERFSAIPTLTENVSFKLTPPFYAP